MAIVFRGLGFGGLSESVANAEECNIMLGSLAATVKAQPADHYDRLEEQAAFYATNGREQDNNKFTFADDVPEQEKKHTQFAFEEVTKTMGRNRDSNIWPFLG